MPGDMSFVVRHGDPHDLAGRTAGVLPVATPLQWDELDTRDLRADRFSIRDVPKRLAQQGDPWADMFWHARSLTWPIEQLAKLRA